MCELALMLPWRGALLFYIPTFVVAEEQEEIEEEEEEEEEGVEALEQDGTYPSFSRSSTKFIDSGNFQVVFR
jgi:hypothetical protein